MKTRKLLSTCLFASLLAPLAVHGCGAKTASDGVTETGNPSLIDDARIFAIALRGTISVEGSQGAVPSKAEVTVTNTRTAETVTTEANKQGSFSVTLEGTPDDTLKIAIQNGAKVTTLVVSAAASPSASVASPIVPATGTSLSAASPSFSTTGPSSTALPPAPVLCDTISTQPLVPNTCGGYVTDLAYSPDGQLLALGARDGNPSIRLWRLSDGKSVPLTDSPDGTGYSVVFSPDGKVLAGAGISSEGASVRLWDVASGTLIRSLPVSSGSYIDTVAFTHDGTRLATAGEKGVTEVWRVADGMKLLEVMASGSVHNVHFSPDDTLLLTAPAGGNARIWNSSDGTLVSDKIHVASELGDADFSPDGTQIASTYDFLNNQIAIWDATTQTLLQKLDGHGKGWVSHVIWLDQDRLLSDDWLGKVILWTRNASGSFELAKSWSTGGQAIGIGVSPDKTTIAVGGGVPAVENGAQTSDVVYTTAFQFLKL